MMRKVLKYILHHLICPLLLACRLDLFLRKKGYNKRLIIMYHGVRLGEKRINGRHIHVEQFDKQLEYFKREFDVIPLRDLCLMRGSGTVPARETIALSFDDGFQNNMQVALPLLQKYRLPATFFVCTAGITDADYLHPSDQIDLIRVSMQDSSTKIGDEVFNKKGSSLLRAKNNEHAYHYINGLSFTQWQAMQTHLKEVVNVSEIQYGELYRLIGVPEMSALAKHDLITVGSHSHHHINMEVLNSTEAANQFLESKKILEQYVGPVDMVAFPYGCYNDRTINIGKESGYQFMIGGGQVDPPFEKDVFPRIGILDGAGFSYTMLMINNAFKRFGF